MLIRTVTRFVLHGVFRRQRLLARPGRILARKGQRLRWNDIVAETTLAPRWMMIDVGRGLSLPPRRAHDFIQRKKGELLAKGDLIASGPAGLFQRNIVSPVPARIIWIGDGRVLLENIETTFSLSALYPGQVCELIGERGVEIECSGALVEGVWGNGNANCGRLRIIEDSLKRTLEPHELDGSLTGLIILGGVCSQGGLLDRCADVGVAGLILASLSAKLIPEALRAPFPIILIQGFGTLPWIDSALKVLRDLVNAEVILNANGNDLPRGNRPEVFSPSEPGDMRTEEMLKPAEAWTPFLTPGQRVRIIAAPYMGRAGTIHRITPAPQVLENGLYVNTAEVVLETRESVIVPIANLDVLE